MAPGFVAVKLGFVTLASLFQGLIEKGAESANWAASYDTQRQVPSDTVAIGCEVHYDKSRPSATVRLPLLGLGDDVVKEESLRSHATDQVKLTLSEGRVFYRCPKKLRLFVQGRVTYLVQQYKELIEGRHVLWRSGTHWIVSTLRLPPFLTHEGRCICCGRTYPASLPSKVEMAEAERGVDSPASKADAESSKRYSEYLL